MNPTIDPLPTVRRDNDEVWTMSDDKGAYPTDRIAMIDLDLGHLNAELGIDVSRSTLRAKQFPTHENLAYMGKGLPIVILGWINCDVEQVQAATGVESESQGMKKSRLALG
jgi:hypothetical protein